MKHKHLVFVYGSLMRGFGNNGLLREQSFQGNATADSLSLFSLGAFPAALHGSGSVKGELWLVDDDALARLDRLEGHPTFYERQDHVALTESGHEVGMQMYIYQGNPSETERIPDGCWRNYATSYQAPTLRS